MQYLSLFFFCHFLKLQFFLFQDTKLAQMEEGIQDDVDKDKDTEKTPAKDVPQTDEVILKL